MRILIVGSGGREHALAWKLSRSPLVEALWIAPGNGGTASCGENVAIADTDTAALVAFAKKEKIDLVVPGPEAALVAGLGDALAEAGIACFGPRSHAAGLEGSKLFAKQMMMEAGVPTAHFATFDDYNKAVEFVEDKGAPLVIKADGLAAGKGVIVCDSRTGAKRALEQIMVERAFGDAGDKVVVEEMLVGEEASFLAFCDGKHIVPMPSSQDHKPIGEGDTGLNTGGMGAYSPAPVLPRKLYSEMTKRVMKPVVQKLAADGHPYVGVLYAGLMLTADGWKVLEYNVRFGDPECQPLLMRLETDLAEIMQACVQGRLDQIDVRWREETAMCVVMAAEGYPESYPKGMEIRGLEQAERIAGLKVFQAGTKIEGGKVVTSGGRVLGVTALGQDLAEARDRAYEGVDQVHFDKAYWRRDIGEKGLARGK